MRKGKLIIPVVGVFLLFLSCSEISKLTKFDMPVSNSMGLPALPMAVPEIKKNTDSISTNYQSSFSANKVSRDFIDKITLKSLTLKVSAPENGSLSFLKSIKVAISSKGLPVKEIAYKTSVPADAGKTLLLDVDKTTDLKEYVLAGKIVMHITLSTSKPTDAPYTLTADAVFNVDAKLLGF